jgi:hypothetical protein
MIGSVIRSFFLRLLLLMQRTFMIAFAGLIGTLLRYWLSGFVARQYGETFPWGNDGDQLDRLFSNWRGVLSN